MAAQVKAVRAGWGCCGYMGWTPACQWRKRR